MAETIQLGGNINLTGFSEVEPIKLIVVKKMVGRYAKELSDRQELQSLDISLELKSGRFKVSTRIVGDQTQECEAEDSNLFVALDKCFKEAQ